METNYLAEPKSGFKIVAENRKAFHDYHILERMEAGLVLTGTEIKSAREGKVQLRDAYADIQGTEAWLMNAHFSPYSHGNLSNHAPLAKRKLLLHRQEINKLIGKVREKGLALIPLKVYLKDGILKCELAIAKGKKDHDKREAIQAKDEEREAKRIMSQRNARNRMD